MSLSNCQMKYKGADIIVGHHPHVVQKPELIDGKPVYFSLGNHLFDQKYSRTKEGLMAEIKIIDGKFYCNGLKTRNQINSFYPEIEGNSEIIFDPVKIRKKGLSINGISVVPANIDVANKSILMGYIKNELKWKSHPMSLVALQKIKIDKDTECLFSLEKYYSSLDKEINIRPYVYAVDSKGITALWRGSALAWPILDAKISPNNNKILCALHRGDSFIMLGNILNDKKVAAYHWNGFGFNVVADSNICKECHEVFDINYD